MDTSFVNTQVVDSKSTVSPSQLIQLFQIMEAQGLTYEQLQVLLKCGIFEDMFERIVKVPDREQWRRILNLSPFLVTEENSNTIVVDYGLSLQVMIEAGGYDCVKLPRTLEGILITGQGIHQFETAYFMYPEECLSSVQVINRIREFDTNNPWEPASFEQALAFGARQREEQRKKIIIALGTNFRPDAFKTAPYLVGNTNYRGVNEQFWDTTWEYGEHFLAVRRHGSIIPIG